MEKIIFRGRNLGERTVLRSGYLKGKKVANHLLDEVSDYFVHNCVKYIIETSEAPFSYTELQLHAMLAPALSEVTDAMLMEHPMTRNDCDNEIEVSNGNLNGRLDYWCRYKGFDFFIELKHGYSSINLMNNKIRKDNIEKWQKVDTQLKSLEGEARRFAKDSTKGVIMISLLILTIKKRTQSYISDFDSNSLMNVQSAYFSNLDPAPNWSFLWKLDKKTRRKCDFHLSDSSINSAEVEKNDGCIYYPAVLFLAKIAEVKK